MSAPLVLRDARSGLGTDRGDIVVVDGRVVHAGPTLDAAALRALAGTSEPETITLAGRRVLPGLVDHHVHLDQWALRRSWPDVSTADGPEAVVAVLAQALRTRPPAPGRPLVAFGVRDGLWRTPPSRSALDALSSGPGSPDGLAIVVVGMDLHQCWLNTAALERYGLPLVEDGMVREQACQPIWDDLRALAPDAMDGLVTQALHAAAARGVTRVTDFEMADNLTAWTRRVAAGAPPVRVDVAVWPEHLEAAIDRGLRTGDVLAAAGAGGAGSAGERVRMGPLKVITDGSLNTRTALCHDPYPGDAGTDHGEHPYGRQLVDPAELRRLLARARRAGLLTAIHAIGDRANTDVLDAFEQTGARGSIEHAQLLVLADVPRFAALGITASVQPEHAMDDRDIAELHWAGRTDRTFLLRSLLDHGARLAFGSDAPVAPLDPWIAMAAAVTRSRDGREPWHPAQRVRIEEALVASTVTGRTAPAVGDVADLVVTDLDLRTASGDELRHGQVRLTVLGGEVTYRDGI